jgi:hypothetical protein
MIDQALDFLRRSLGDWLTRLAHGDLNSQPAPPAVVFLGGDQVKDAVQFTNNTVTALLVKLEEENTLRPADPFTRVGADGIRQRVQPGVRLNLYVLFVAQFGDYLDALRRLSDIVRFFQQNRVFTSANAPNLGAIEQLTLEFVTLPFSEQNEIWGALRTSFRPSVLYRVRMVAFEDQSPVAMPATREVQVEISRIIPNP